MTDNTQVFQLEQIYVVLTGSGVQVLARTPGVRPEHMVECRRVANLLPPPVEQRNPSMSGSLGLFRGETVDYVIARAQQWRGEAPVIHYMLVPTAPLRRLGGNLHLLEPFAREPFPQLTGPRADLPPYVMDKPAPPDAEMQTMDLLALLGYCKNTVKTVSGLLAGLVQGMGLGIINAPLAMHDRLTFVQGLLTLLPAPARIAITFATSVIDPAQTNAQIKFLTADAPLERHLIFDWASGQLRGEVPDDPYTKFIIAQLRLDTSLVVGETEKLARTAVWRAMRRENMAEALTWASRRASLDNAVQEGLPADRAMVAAVLREDPTLPDDLRVSYSRHLLTLSLATGDPSHTDIIPAIAAQKKEVADTVYERLWSAAGGEHALAVYRIVEQWIANAPMGVDVSRWRPLLGMSLTARLNTLLPGEAADLVAFLHSFLDASPALQLESTVMQMISLCRKRAYDNPNIARELFLLAATYVPLGGWQRMLGDTQFLPQIPQALRNVFFFLAPNTAVPAPPGLLARGAEVYGPERQGLLLSRLVEWALFARRIVLIDAEALRGMVQVAITPLGARFDKLIQHVVDDLNQVGVVRALEPAAQRYLLELILARKHYEDAVSQLVLYQDMVYQTTRQEELAKIVCTAYREAPLDTPSLLLALGAVHGSQLKPVIIAHADIGVLEAKNWSAEAEPAARHLSELLYADPRLVAAISLDPALRLLKANAGRQDMNTALKLAGAIVAYTLMFGEHGPETIDQVYSMVNWDAVIGKAALGLVQNYVRRAPLDRAGRIPRLLGDKYGEPMRIALEATYRLRLVVGGFDLGAFDEQLQVATRLLFDISNFYHDNKDIPPIIKLRRNVDSMPGGLNEAEGKRLSQRLNLIAEQVLKLYNLHQARNARRSRGDLEMRRQALTQAKTAPTTAIEALIWLSGHIGKGQPVALKWSTEAPAYLLGTRSVNMLLREVEQVAQLLNGLLAAFPDDFNLEIAPDIWAVEADTLWAQISLYAQRSIFDGLVENTQSFALLLLDIGEKGNERSLQASGYGKQLYTGKAQPRSVVEVLRWLSGYFAHEHNK